jgi:1-acylglycerone phosphate reductase
LKPLGISVVEVVTGFVRSNILHHGLYAAQDSFYLPIKSTIEQIKYKGNANGMPTDAYARSVVSKVMRGSTGPEIWEGKLAWVLRLMVGWFPLSLLVCSASRPST